jgi:hypothetical protein
MRRPERYRPENYTVEVLELQPSYDCTRCNALISSESDWSHLSSQGMDGESVRCSGVSKAQLKER